MPGNPPVQPALAAEQLRRIDELCDQFESALAAGQTPPLEGLLGQVAEQARPRLFRHLLELEMRHRRQAGNPIMAREAHDRFANCGPWAAGALRELGLDLPPTTAIAARQDRLFVYLTLQEALQRCGTPTAKFK